MAVLSKKITTVSDFYEIELSKADYRKYQCIEVYHSILFVLTIPVAPIPALTYAVVGKWLNVLSINPPAAALTFFALLVMGCVLSAYLMNKVISRSKAKEEKLLVKLGWQGESPYFVVRSSE